MISSKPLHEVCTWDQHYDRLVNPNLMTGLLRTAIPVLEHCDWHVKTVREGYCETVLPLNGASTNQHGTHQAALISLSADYTGGLALATLLRGIPLAGVHRCTDDESASLWLAAMNVKYIAPSAGHLTGVCEIDPKTKKNIETRYARGSRVLVSLEIKFYSNAELIAVADMKYFAQPSIQLSPTKEKPARSKLFQHKLKASARMIAGLRAQPSDHPRMNFPCPYSAIAAGPHGELLAGKLQQKLPQLRDMVHARSQHIDETIDDSPSLRQIVMVGAGLDFRSLRHAEGRRDVTFFEIDLPEMIEERQRIAETISDNHAARRVLLEADFRQDSVDKVLLRNSEFRPELETLFIYEGCSMYFTEQENRAMLSDIQKVMHHPNSQVWMDCVNESVSMRRTNNQGILAFLDGMEDMGETFIFGVTDVASWMVASGFEAVNVKLCGTYLDDPDPVLNSYAFATARN